MIKNYLGRINAERGFIKYDEEGSRTVGCVSFYRATSLPNLLSHRFPEIETCLLPIELVQ